MVKWVCSNQTARTSFRSQKHNQWILHLQQCCDWRKLHLGKMEKESSGNRRLGRPSRRWNTTHHAKKLKRHANFIAPTWQRHFLSCRWLRSFLQQRRVVSQRYKNQHSFWLCRWEFPTLQLPVTRRQRVHLHVPQADRASAQVVQPRCNFGFKWIRCRKWRSSGRVHNNAKRVSLLDQTTDAA